MKRFPNTVGAINAEEHADFVRGLTSAELEALDPINPDWAMVIRNPPPEYNDDEPVDFSTDQEPRYPIEKLAS